MTKICICFYGLVQRSIKYTFDSIQTNIFNVLKNNNIEYDVYLHTYDATFSNSDRSGEYDIPVDVDDYKLLNPSKYIIESYDDFNKNFNFYQFTKKYSDPWNNNYSSMINWIREMNSHSRVTELWETNKNVYDLCLYVRADLMYITPLPIEYLLNKLSLFDNFDWKTYITHYPDLSFITDKQCAWNHWISNGKVEGRIYFTHEDKIFTVPWGQHGGLNDLIGIGDCYAIIKWAKRLHTLHEYMQTIGNNSEQMVLYICYKYKITNIDLPMLFYRVRANGNRVNEVWNYPEYSNIKDQCIRDGGEINL